jgi:cytochrome c-type biogenesis protein CcmH/NrfF
MVNDVSDVKHERWFQICQKLRCPTCINLDLCNSETPQSLAMKKDILMRMNTQTNEEILSHYVQSYSEWILTKPPFAKAQFHWFWSLPALFFLTGLIIIHKPFKKLRRL